MDLDGFEPSTSCNAMEARSQLQTFLGTAKKLGVNFYYYIRNRITLKSARSSHWLNSFGNGPGISRLMPYGPFLKAPNYLRRFAN